MKAWLAENPRFRVHFTLTSASWLNLVEVWFGIIERQALHRADVASVPELNMRIRPSSPAGTTAITPSGGPRPAPRS
ncbi:hypothetical protein ACH9DO_05730 [Kocuria sp. M1N1S27]|uniref:hypothetical protein n=1 Tax=Kocuria kalidii TaxID=3376283 RepID=UPI0037A5FE46